MLWFNYIRSSARAEKLRQEKYRDTNKKLKQLKSQRSGGKGENTSG